MAAEVKAKFEGKWKNYKDENLDKMLDVMDVGFMKKKIMTNSTPTMELSVSGDTINVNMTVGPKTNKASFKLGEEFDGEDPIPGKRLATFENGKLVLVITPKDSTKKPLRQERDIVDGDMVITMTMGDVSAKRFFKKQ